MNSVGSPTALGDQTVTEGNSGTQNMVFTVKLSQASTQTVKVDYSTADNSPAVAAATAGQDYVAKSGTLTFAPGVTAQRSPSRSTVTGWTSRMRRSSST